MAQNEVSTQQVVALPADVYMRREAAKEYEAMRASGVKLDECRPGGYFLGADGRPHDANGKLIEEPVAEPVAEPAAEEKKAAKK